MSGRSFTDQFSLLHFASGVIAYFWGVPIVWWFVLHALFELFEDTPTGVYLVNKLFGNIWPGGGKKVPDSFTNSELGDNFYAMLGWIVSSWLDKQRQNLKNKNILNTRNGRD